MFKRLVFLLMLVGATVFAHTPTQAATLTVTWDCDWAWLGDTGPSFAMICTARASGGTGPYTYRWYRDSSLTKTETTTGSSNKTYKCNSGNKQTTFQVTVTDSTGAQAATPLETYGCSYWS